MHCSFSFRIDYKSIFSFIYFGFFEKVGYLRSSGIRGGIIDDNDVIVAIILHENGSDVFEVSFILGVVESGHNYTEWKLLVLADVVF